MTTPCIHTQVTDKTMVFDRLWYCSSVPSVPNLQLNYDLQLFLQQNIRKLVVRQAHNISSFDSLSFGIEDITEEWRD